MIQFFFVIFQSLLLINSSSLNDQMYFVSHQGSKNFVNPNLLQSVCIDDSIVCESHHPDVIKCFRSFNKWMCISDSAQIKVASIVCFHQFGPTTGSDGSCTIFFTIDISEIQQDPTQKPNDYNHFIKQSIMFIQFLFVFVVLLKTLINYSIS